MKLLCGPNFELERNPAICSKGQDRCPFFTISGLGAALRVVAIAHFFSGNWLKIMTIILLYKLVGNKKRNICFQICLKKKYYYQHQHYHSSCSYHPDHPLKFQVSTYQKWTEWMWNVQRFFWRHYTISKLRVCDTWFGTHFTLFNRRFCLKWSCH